ncbi:nitroreductase family protein [Tissierella sp. Yu-01]|uniref:nitroreductase family protein n=1 Tax=Tissierella sp. Yu-01 TaxID=3035694 RepID=UPI00240D2DFC|nr:nitroreductase family protein [Tissierella sp. Yu-01]WFA09323.1 nitroreductase family protein [Tissierella sp. Yu-01]
MGYELLEILKNRRSIRKFKEEKVAKEVIEQVLKAGLLAPSSKNKKPVQFIVVEDKDTLLKLKECKSKGADAFNTAPCAIVVIADNQLSDVWIEDASIATILLQTAAENLGLGSVWIQMRNRQNNIGNSEDEVRKVLNIPENYGVLSIVAIGYKDEIKEPYNENSLDFSKIHYDKY